jgi:hypothetical protein
MRRKTDWLWLVCSELDGRLGVSVCSEDTALVDDLRVPLPLFGVYAYTSECLDCRRRRRGNLTPWVGWGAGRMLSHENEAHEVVGQLH